jgi:hypothetical protein
MPTHDLKTWPAPFQAVLDGRKTHEIRVADRPFAVGDVLLLREWNPEPAERPRGYTGRSVEVDVMYLTSGGAWELPYHLCVMSIRLRRPPPGCTCDPDHEPGCPVLAQTWGECGVSGRCPTCGGES